MVMERSCDKAEVAGEGKDKRQLSKVKVFEYHSGERESYSRRVVVE